jgi:hypothetical protein
VAGSEGSPRKALISSFRNLYMMKEYSCRIVPRDYGLVQTGKNVPMFITPAAFAIGESLRLTESELNRLIPSWQEYKTNQFEESQTGGSYTPLFPVGTKNQNLLSLRPDVLRDKRIIPGIKIGEGTKNLWRVGGEKAIEDGYLGSRILTGRVKSKEDGRASDRMRTWQAVLNMDLSEEGDISDYSDALCQCHDHMWVRTKGVAKICVHLASLMNALADENSHIERQYPGRGFWLPFNFISDTGLPEGLSDEDLENLSMLTYLDQEVPPPRSHLMMDLLISHYVMKRKYFDLNKSATMIPNIYHGNIVRGIVSGDLKFGVIRQKRGKKKDNDYWNAVESMWKEMYQFLQKSGYERSGATYSLEFRGTEFESLCEDWVRDGVTLRPMFHEKVPPLVIQRNEIPDSEPSPFRTDYNARNPFAQLDQEQIRTDDSTRRKTSFTVRIPRNVNIPDVLKPLYRKFIDLYYHGDRQVLKDSYDL